MLDWIKLHKWKTALLIIIALLWMTLEFLLQPIVKQSIQNYTQNYAIEKVELQDLDISLFSGSLYLKELSLFKSVDDSDPLVHLGNLELNLKLLALLQNRIEIDSLTIANAKLPFTLDNENLSLAGIPLTSNDSNKDQSQSSTLLPGLDDIRIEDVAISLTSQGKTSQLEIEELTLNHLFAWSENHGRLFLKSRLNGTPIQATLKLYLFEKFPKIVGTIRSHGIHIAELKHLMPKLEFAIDAKIHSDTTFTLAHSRSGLRLYQQGNINLRQLNYRSEQQTLKANSLSWKGDVHYRQNAIAEIDLNGELQSKRFDFKQQQLQTQLDSLSLKGKTLVKLSAQPNIKTQQTVNFNALEFNMPEQQLALKTNLNSNLKAQLNMAQKTLNLESQLKLQKLTAQQADYQIALAQFSHNNNLNLNYENMTYQAAIKAVQLANLEVLQSQQKLTLAQQKTLNIGSLQLNSEGQYYADNIQINKLAIAKPAQSESAFVVVDKLAVNQLQLQTAEQTPQIIIDQLRLTGSQTQLTLSKQNSILEIDQLTASSPTTQQQAESQTEQDAKEQSVAAASPGLHYQINKIQLDGSNPIMLTNQQVEPAMQKTITLNNFVIENIDSSKPTQISPYNLVVQLDEFSKFSSKGELTPLQPKHYVSASTKIDGMSLVELSPFAESQVGYHIASGQLSAELETKLENNLIDAKNELHLHKLKLESLNTEQAKKVQQNFPIPLETGLSLLQDKNENIDLSLPIQGDINNPNFDINDIISKALGKAMAGATRTYLLFALQPFGAIAMATEYAANQASAINLQPVEFTPGSAKLNSNMQVYLQKIFTMIADRPGLQIKLCGGVSEADRFVLKQKAIKQAIEKQASSQTQPNKDGKPAPQQAIRVPDVEISNNQLFEFAKQRQAAIKRYLMKRGAASKQLILCKPEISKNQQKSLVELNI